MSKAEILAELPKLATDELAEVQTRIDELAGEAWLDGGELADADLRPLQIGHDADGAPGLVRSSAQQGDALLVIIHRAMRKIQAHHIDAGLNQAAQWCWIRRRGAEGGDDFGST